MNTLLGNAFSLNMITPPTTIDVVPVAASDVPPDAVSVIGHADTARVVGSLLGRDVSMNRATVQLSPGDVLYVAQYSGPRLVEGATSLPDGARMSFLKVTLRA